MVSEEAQVSDLTKTAVINIFKELENWKYENDRQPNENFNKETENDKEKTQKKSGSEKYSKLNWKIIYKGSALGLNT